MGYELSIWGDSLSILSYVPFWNTIECSELLMNRCLMGRKQTKLCPDVHFLQRITFRDGSFPLPLPLFHLFFFSFTPHHQRFKHSGALGGWRGPVYGTTARSLRGLFRPRPAPREWPTDAGGLALQFLVSLRRPMAEARPKKKEETKIFLLKIKILTAPNVFN